MIEEPKQRIWGVDFSAAEDDAGRQTWIADCHVENGNLEVDGLSSASEHLGSRTKKRETVLEELTIAIGDLDGGTVGMDFPFGLPKEFLGTDDWASFVRKVPEEWGNLDGVDDPVSLYDVVEKRAADSDDEPTRETDEAHEGQNPAGFRIRTQTYYGISAVLKPLVEDHDVAIPPIYPNEDAVVDVIETYPAAVFADLDAVRNGYKSDDRAGIVTRRRNLAILERNGIKLTAADADCAIGTDDALDALAAAYAAWKADESSPNWPGEPAATEGEIYSG
jgi:hypothetical protein